MPALSALDVASRREILPYLERLHCELEIPVIHISHALDEVARLANHVVMLEQGRVIASGAPNEILTRLDFFGGCLWVSKVEHDVGSVVRARVLARDVSIATLVPQGSSITNILLSRITRRSRDQLGLAEGMEIFAQVKSVALIT